MLNDKENDVPSLSQHLPKAQPKPTQNSPHKGPPSTPATRLPLADLIGDSEAIRKSDSSAINFSPEAHVQWNIQRSPQGSRPRTATRSAKKRARSSSPPSSSVRSASRHLKRSNKAPSELQDLKKDLKTPQADPAAELWNRYTCASSKDASLDPKVVALAEFSSSSPYADKNQASNVSGLRRWTSCGVEWPSARAKKRKLQHIPTTLSNIEEAFVDLPKSGANDSVGRMKSARITTLLDRISEDLVKSKQLSPEDKGPSSSSPLPERQEGFDRESISPCRAGELASKVAMKSMSSGRNHDDPNCEESDELTSHLRNTTSSSFGGNDLDLALIKDGEALQDLTASQNLRRIEMHHPHAPTDTDDYRYETGHDENAEQAAAQQLEEFDEFGNEDDVFAADLEIVASKYDTADPSTLSEQRTSSHLVRSSETLFGSLGDGDEFGEDDIDEESFAAAEATATQSMRTDNRRRKIAIQRYLVIQVFDERETTRQANHHPQIKLVIEEDTTRTKRTIELRGSWIDTRCTKGAFVHVIGEFDSSGNCVIDDVHGMIILHPDHLISAGVVADSFGCLRRAVLQDRIKATSEASPPLVYGTMLHELFQEALTANRWDDVWMKSAVQGIIEKHIEDLYAIQVDVTQAIDHFESKVAALQAWADKFVRIEPGPDATVKDRNGSSIQMSINKLLDVEEHIWSPMYGLKGNMDATVQVCMRDDEGQRTLTVPLELKTGKTSNPSHRAQTALYTLLLSDRYDVAVAYGILYNLETCEMARVPAIRHELRHMVMQRNELACYVRERLSLPPMLKQTHLCSRCYAKNPCFLYHKLVEDGDGETSGMRNKFDDIAGHLQPSHQEFFKKWDDLLTKEETEMMKFRRELWTMLSTAREKMGRCFANVSLLPSSGREDRGTSKINRFQYTFHKLNHGPGFAFNESQIAVGEPIVVSDEKGHYALAKGYVTASSRYRIAVAVDRRLQSARRRNKGFDEITNQSFVGVMEVAKRRESSQSRCSQEAESLKYRIDKDEFSNGMATVRNNLVEIMSRDTYRAREIRDMVVGDVEPRFKKTPSSYATTEPPSQSCINQDQKAAIDKIMSAEDYALVLGMPGTGKTTTIAHIIRALVTNGKSVLLTSYTHTAVDNILLKIKRDRIGVLRLGTTTKVHPDVREFAVLGAEPKATIEELRKVYHGPQVVATTCLGINHQVFNERTFDYCIVDEASQITLPVCLGPIRMAKAFVLVGDHNQLPPLVQNREALEGGLDISLFKLLSERHPSAVATLHHQYRMNSDIMELSNTLIYSGQLTCGSEAVASRRLELPNFDRLAQLHQHSQSQDSSQQSASRTACPSLTHTSCWLNRALSANSPPVVFLNTDPLFPSSAETLKGSRITNHLEATLTQRLVCALLLAGLPPSSLGIITAYRSQLALIKASLTTSRSSPLKPSSGTAASISPAAASQIEAHTTDRFQGRDKDVIILSLARSNDRGVVGDLLKDWRRVNVAVTRARSKLVILGSRATLAKGDELLGRLVGLCEGRGWMVDLPTGRGLGVEGDAGHCWGDGGGSVWGAETSPGKSQEAPRGPGEAEVQGGAFRNQKEVSPSKPARVPLAPRYVNPCSLSPPLAKRTGRSAAGVNGKGKEGVKKPFKVPAKVGKIRQETIVKKGSVLMDIVNDALGDVDGGAI